MYMMMIVVYELDRAVVR